jgi:uncharacterized protein YdaT
MIGPNLIKNPPPLDIAAFKNIKSMGKTVAAWFATLIIGSAGLTACNGNNGNNTNIPCPATPYDYSGQVLIDMENGCKDLAKFEKQALEKYVYPDAMIAGDNFTKNLTRDVIYEFAKLVKYTSPETPERFSPEDIGRILQILPEQEFKKLDQIPPLYFLSVDKNQQREKQNQFQNKVKAVVDQVIAPFPKNMTGKDIVAALEILHQSPQKFEYLDKTTPTQEIERGNNILTQAYLTNKFIPETMEKAPKDWAFTDVSKVIENVKLADYSSTEFQGTKHWEDAAKSAIGIIQKLTDAGLSKTDALRILNLDAIGGENVGLENLSKSVNRVASLINEMKEAVIQPTLPSVVAKMKTANPPIDPLNTGLTPSPDLERKDNYTPIPDKIQKLYYDAAETALHEGSTETFKKSFVTALNAAPNKAGAMEFILSNLEPLDDKPEEMKNKVNFAIDYIKGNYPQALNTLMFTLFTGKNSSETTIANKETLDKLVQAGANPAAVDTDGFNIPAKVSYFQAGQEVEIRKLFENYGVKINVLPESQAPSYTERP